MAYVVGLDLNVTRVSAAVITRRVDGSTIANVASFTSRAPAGEERIADLVALADRAVCNPVLAVVPPADGSPAGALRRAVLATLASRGVQVVTIPPPEYTLDLVALWPAVTLANPGEATALHLAHLGALREGWPVPELPRVAEVVAG